MKPIAVLVAVASALTLACSGSTTPSPPLNLAGTWSGMLGQPQSGSALRLTWSAVQNGATVSGPATLVKPAVNVTATGTLAGTLSDHALTLALSVPAGGVPVYLSCTIAGNGSATANSQTIAGSLQATFTNCLGSGLEAPESTQLTLTKQ